MTASVEELALDAGYGACQQCTQSCSFVIVDLLLKVRSTCNSSVPVCSPMGQDEVGALPG